MEIPGFYVTGTDTGAGKTVASAALLHALRAAGREAVGMKPVASGSTRVDGVLRSQDALLLQEASDPRPAYDDLNPYALERPLAPELAAMAEGRSVELAPLLEAFERLQAPGRTLVVEGVGGWAAPLSPTLDQADVARALRLPVVLVVGLRTGCINHARLTMRAIADDGLRVAGWIGCEVDPGMERVDESCRVVGERLAAPCWGRIPFADPVDPAALARHVEIPDAALGLVPPGLTPPPQAPR